MLRKNVDSTIPLCATLLLSVAWIAGVNAFVVKSFCRDGRPRTPLTCMIPDAIAAPHLADEAFSIVGHEPSILISDAMDVVTNIAIAIGGTIAVLAAFAILFSTFIIPAAADQLKKQVKELDPVMWQEYEKKLEAGETLAMRPDLMQELGNKVQAKALAKFENTDTQLNELKSSPTTNIIDAEVVCKKEGEKD